MPKSDLVAPVGTWGSRSRFCGTGADPTAPQGVVSDLPYHARGTMRYIEDGCLDLVLLYV